jgi:hypothetical protein
MSLKAAQAVAFLKDLAAGMSDDALQKKYELSPRDFLIHKAASKDLMEKYRKSVQNNKRKINAQNLLKDIRDHLDEESLMVKYELTARQLQYLLRRIIAEGLATPRELAGLLSVTKSQITQVFVDLGRPPDE